MFTTSKCLKSFCAITAGLLLFSSCKKSDLNTTSTPTADSVASLTSSTIAIAGTDVPVSLSTAVTDSVYLLQPCASGGKRDSISEANLSTAIETYIQANYAGATFSKAFILYDSAQQIAGYAVVIYYNHKPVELQFDSAGGFVKVLEQREKGDLNGSGRHGGGRFGDVDGKGRDSIPLADLPMDVTSYFISNYTSDTLIKAFRNRDSSLVVISTNDGVFATVFSATGTFIIRHELDHVKGHSYSIAFAALPANVSAYLTTSYPNYVFKKAFIIKQNDVVVGYVVIIDANNTKYAVEFDSEGNFTADTTIQ